MDRIEYLLRVAHDFFLVYPYMQEECLLYDGADCDGGCLMNDIEIELGLDDGEFALSETEGYLKERDG